MACNIPKFSLVHYPNKKLHIHSFIHIIPRTILPFPPSSNFPFLYGDGERGGKKAMETVDLGGKVITAKQDIVAAEERVSDVLGRWTALQMAVQNKWGGRNSREKSNQLRSDILFWLFHSKESLEAEDLESFLHERLLLSFNTEIEDGSIEEVAEQLMLLREEYLQGNIYSVR